MSRAKQLYLHSRSIVTFSDGAISNSDSDLLTENFNWFSGCYESRVGARVLKIIVTLIKRWRHTKKTSKINKIVNERNPNRACYAFHKTKHEPLYHLISLHGQHSDARMRFRFAFMLRDFVKIFAALPTIKIPFAEKNFLCINIWAESEERVEENEEASRLTFSLECMTVPLQEDPFMLLLWLSPLVLSNLLLLLLVFESSSSSDSPIS